MKAFVCAGSQHVCLFCSEETLKPVSARCGFAEGAGCISRSKVKGLQGVLGLCHIRLSSSKLERCVRWRWRSSSVMFTRGPCFSQAAGLSCEA